MSHVQALPEGTELVSDFRIERVLGAGGFGITYLAREIALDRYVTIKEYFPGDFAARGGNANAIPRSAECAPDYQWGLDRFIEEAQTLAKFDHPNIVRVYRYFRANDTGYMVLHFEEGQSLKSWLQSLGRAPRQAEMDELIAPLLEALDVIHAADFLHRDIAPDNIMVRSDGSPVLIDFGSARGEIAQHSRTVSALVKPGYSPYEQYGAIGRQQGPWTDIYALSATLYHAITGKRPPDAPSRIVNDEFIPAREAALSAYRPSFLQAVDRGLELDIDKRPQAIAGWRGELLGAGETATVHSGDRPAAPTLALTERLSTEELPGAAATTEAPDMPAYASPPFVPPPPDQPGRRGRIVDFLDGVRRSPRDGAPTQPSGDQAPEATDNPGADPGRTDEPVPQTLDTVTSEPEPSAKRGRYFLRGAWVRPEPETSDTIAAHDRPVEINSTPVGARTPEPRRLAVIKRRPPRPRPLREGPRWRWRPLIMKLAIGVCVAMAAVQLQNTLPQYMLRSNGTVASGPITGSIAISSNGTSAARVMPPPPAQRKLASLAATPSAAKPAAAASLLLKTFESHPGGVTALQFADQGRKLATIGSDATLKLWDGDSYELIRTLELEHGPATALAVDGNRALTGHESGHIALWQLDLGMQLKTFKRNDAPIKALAFAGPDRFLAAGNDWSLSLWDIATQSLPLHVFEGHQRDILDVAYEAGSGLIATASADRTVKLWDAKSLSLVRTYPRAEDFVTAVGFSPDGGSLLTGTLRGSVSLYSTERRRRLRRFTGHKGRITSLTFFTGGREFVSASRDGTVRLWNRRRSNALQTFGSAGARIADATVSADGRLIASAKDNGTVQIWNGAILD